MDNLGMGFTHYDNYPPGVTGAEWQITGEKPPRYVRKPKKENPLAVPPVLCDGCNVRSGHEHRCHNIGFAGYIMVKGDRRYRRCDCQDCRVLWDDEFWQRVKERESK